jgi:hypothetical protein
MLFAGILKQARTVLSSTTESILGSSTRPTLPMSSGPRASGSQPVVARKAEEPSTKPERRGASAGGAAHAAEQSLKSKELQRSRSSDSSLSRVADEITASGQTLTSEGGIQRRTVEKKRGTSEAERIDRAAEQIQTAVMHRVTDVPLRAAEIHAAGAEKKDERATGKISLTVVDLRKQTQARQPSAGSDKRLDDQNSLRALDSRAEVKETRSTEIRELTLDGRGVSADRSRGSGDAPWTPPAHSDFRALLAERLQNAWNTEIVQSARIVLRDGDSGTIRLRLKPESLGNVKIELNLTDNNISGRIVVESDEAKSAFERNMSELADAFRRGGFESASLQVSVGSGSGSGGRPSGGTEDLPFYSERLRAAVESSAEPSTASAAFTRQGLTVDMLA